MSAFLYKGLSQIDQNHESHIYGVLCMLLTIISIGSWFEKWNDEVSWGCSFDTQCLLRDFFHWATVFSQWLSELGRVSMWQHSAKPPGCEETWCRHTFQNPNHWTTRDSLWFVDDCRHGFQLMSFYLTTNTNKHKYAITIIVVLSAHWVEWSVWGQWLVCVYTNKRTHCEWHWHYKLNNHFWKAHGCNHDSEEGMTCCVTWDTVMWITCHGCDGWCGLASRPKPISVW